MSSSTSLMYLKVPHKLFFWSPACLSGFCMYSLHFKICLVFFVFVYPPHFYNKFCRFVQTLGEVDNETKQENPMYNSFTNTFKKLVSQEDETVDITKFLVLIFSWVGLCLYTVVELAFPLSIYPSMNIFS